MMSMLSVDNRPRKARWHRGTGGVAWRQAWKFKGDVDSLFDELTAGEAKPVVHVCSGSSRYGDVTVDLTSRVAMVRGDARQLPIRNAGCILIDPPYHMALDERQRFMRGCVAALRKGGVLIVHAPWMPKDNRLEFVEPAYLRFTTRGLGFPSAPVIVSKWRLKHTRSSSGRWRSRPTVRTAIAGGMKVGTLMGAA